MFNTTEFKEAKWRAALQFTTKQHANQTRIGGQAYITHPLAVVEILIKKGFSDDYLIVGLFHDLLEDTAATPDEILQLSNESVLEAVQRLTKTKGYQMEQYAKTLDEMDLSKQVKLADRLHNLRSALVASQCFRLRYIEETEMYYVPMAKGTLFEADIQQALNDLKAAVYCENT